MGHMIETYRLNPAWVAQQSQTALNTSRIMADTNRTISNTIMQTWKEHGIAIDRAMDADARARLGIDVYQDQATGTRYTVASGHNFYWKDARGHIVGTNTDTSPGSGFSKLDHVPAGR